MDDDRPLAVGARAARLLLVAFAASAATIGSPLPGAASDQKVERAFAVIGDLTREHQSAIAVGRRYLEAHPEERDPLVLLTLLGFDLTSAASIRATVRARSRADFASGDIVILDGWVLARTESRAFALMVLAEEAMTASVPPTFASDAGGADHR